MYKKNLYIMYAIAGLQGMVFYGPIATLYRQAQGVTIFEITIIESISLALCIVLELPWGIIADKIGYKRTIIICNTLFFISKIVFWKASGFFGFLAERIILSVVLAGLSGVDTSILYLSCKKEESHKVFGIYNGLGTSGLLIASLIYSFFIGSNYKLSALLTAISYGLSLLLSLFLVEVKSKQKDKIKNNNTGFLKLIVLVFKNKSLLFFLISVALLNETHQTITVFINQIQYVKAGISLNTIGLVYILVTLLGLCSTFSSKVTEKIGAFKLSKICYLIAIISCISLAFTSSAVVSIAAVLLLRIVFSLFQPLQINLQNRQVISENRATNLSIYAVIINSVGISTNMMFGALAERNISLSFFFGAISCLVGLIFFTIWDRVTGDKLLCVE